VTDRLDLRRRLHELAFRQAGYVSAAQALKVGYSYQAQKYHVDRGNWIKVDRGMFRLAEWPSTPGDVYARWTVWSESRGVVSFQSAASVHGLGDFISRQVHLTLLRARPRTNGVMLHWARLEDDDVEDHGTYRVTTPTRTLLDLASEDVSQGQFLVAVQGALSSGQVDEDALIRHMDGMGSRAATRLRRAIDSVTANGD